MDVALIGPNYDSTLRRIMKNSEQCLRVVCQRQHQRRREHGRDTHGLPITEKHRPDLAVNLWELSTSISAIDRRCGTISISGREPSPLVIIELSCLPRLAPVRCTLSVRPLAHRLKKSAVRLDYKRSQRRIPLAGLPPLPRSALSPLKRICQEDGWTAPTFSFRAVLLLCSIHPSFLVTKKIR
jgi:hypothetical protein